MDLHLRDLRYFVAAAEKLHFTRAAERLHVSRNARIYRRPGACCVAVPDLSLCDLAVARRRDDRRRAVLDFVAAAIAASAKPR